MRLGYCVCFFFFSSRRRHTRYWRDWSSTCALPISYQELIAVHPENLQARIGLAQVFRWSQRYVESEEQLREVLRADPKNRDAIYGMAQSAALAGDFRSEERRVGKEWKSGWSTE